MTNVSGCRGSDRPGLGWTRATVALIRCGTDLPHDRSPTGHDLVDGSDAVDGSGPPPLRPARTGPPRTIVYTPRAFSPLTRFSNMRRSFPVTGLLLASLALAACTSGAAAPT